MINYTAENKYFVESMCLEHINTKGDKYFFDWALSEQMLDQITNKDGTWAVWSNPGLLYALLGYTKVEPSDVTFMCDHPTAARFAMQLGVRVLPRDSVEDEKFRKHIKRFDNSIAVVNPIVKNKDKKKGVTGTNGNNQAGQKVNRLVVELTKPGGNVVFTTLKEGGLNDALRNQDWNPLTIGLMTERENKHNLCWLHGIKEPNTNQQLAFYTTDIKSRISAKLFEPRKDQRVEHHNQSLSYKDLYKKGHITDTDNGNGLVIVRSKKQYDLQLKRAYPTSKGLARVIHGPKFSTYRQESSLSWLATDEPMLCDISSVYPTKTLADAESMHLFTANNPIMKFTWQAWHIKGKDHFWRYGKKFDLSQIKTGYEYPAEFNLTDEEIRWLEDTYTVQEG